MAAAYSVAQEAAVDEASDAGSYGAQLAELLSSAYATPALAPTAPTRTIEAMVQATDDGIVTYKAYDTESAAVDPLPEEGASTTTTSSRSL